jgi:tetratricopeptide (TPR) repeat protein
MHKLYFVLITIVFFISCKTENSTKGAAKSDINLAKTLGEAENLYEKDPSDQNYSKLMQVYGKSIISEENKDAKVKMLVSAIKKSEKAIKHNMALTFAYELIKTDPLHPTCKEYYRFLADQMEMQKKDDVATFIMAGYLRHFGTKGENERVMLSLPGWHKDLNKYLKEASKKMYVDPDANGLNIEATKRYVDLCEAYAIGHPKNAETPEYLFKSAEMARSVGEISKTIELYDWIIRYYPDHKHAPTALFLKGFTIENELKNYALARTCYESFLEKYPQDPVAKDVSFLLKNLGKADSLVIKDFEKKD